MEKTFTLTLSDGSVIENLGLKGNNFVSTKKITADDFEGKLERVTVLDNETQETEVLEDQVLVQCIKYDKEYWFILRDKSAEEKFAEENEALTARADRTTAVQEYNIMMGNLEDPSEDEE